MRGLDKIAYLLFIICCINNVNAQVSTQELLDYNLTYLQKAFEESGNIEDLKSIGWIQKMELRSSTDEWDLQRQQYTFRLSFNDYKANKLIEDREDIKLSKLSLIELTYIEEGLERYYEYIIDVYTKEKYLKSLQAKQAYWEDLIKIYENALQRENDYDISKLLSAKISLRELQLDLAILDDELKRFWSNLYAEGTHQLSQDNFITIEQIEANTLMFSDYDVLSTREKLKTLNLADRKLEYDREISRSKMLFDFVQMSYAGRNNQNFGNELSFGFGLNLPFKKNNQRQINDAYLDLKEEELELFQLNLDKNNKLSGITSELMANINKYKLVDEMLKEDLFEKDFSSTSYNEKLIVFDIERNINRIDRTLMQFDLENEILRLYIEYLKDKGLLRSYMTYDFLNGSSNLPTVGK